MARYWRRITDVAKRFNFTLRVADRLGRGHGRMRVLDRLVSVPPAPNVPELVDWETRDLSAVWLGHATVLLRVGGMTILTDPVLSTRVGLGFGVITAGPARLVQPALSVRDLPPIDLILLSHAHFDHLDRPTLVKMNRKTPVITAGRTADLIDDLHFARVDELDWGESMRVGQLTITARRVTHWGARTFLDRHRGYNAYLIESPTHRVLYGGDTAFHDDFRDIGPVDLAILGIGAYDPYIAAHASPEQAWAMAQHVEAKHVLPIHHSTFKLSHEPVDEPLRRLRAAAGNEADRIVGSLIGQEWTMDRRPA